MSMTLQAQFIPTHTHLAATGQRFCVACMILAREKPVCVRPFGTMFYDGMTIPILRRHPPRFGQTDVFEPLRFMRSRHFGEQCVPAGGRLVVRSELRRDLEKVVRAEFVRAECVGIIDAHPLDVVEMDRLSHRFSSSPDPMKVCKVAGRFVKENDWWEVLTPSWSADAGNQGDAVIVDVEAKARSEHAADGVAWPLFPKEPMNWRVLQAHGMVSGRAHAMSVEAAHLLVPLLPNPFWWISHWSVP
jgi:hypothetical protein